MPLTPFISMPMYLLEPFQYQTNTGTPYNQVAFLSTLGLTHMWGISSHGILLFVYLYTWGFLLCLYGKNMGI